MDGKQLLTAAGGSTRYGYASTESDNDLFILTKDRTESVVDTDDRIDRFFVSIANVKASFWDPLFLGNLTGDCTGDKRLVAFLQSRRHAITYAAPGKTADFGLDYIAVGERYGHTSPIKAGLRTAYILSHMAAEAEDPFLLTDEEKAVLIRARAGEVPPEERVGIYRRTLCPGNLDKLRRMPENTKVRDELFALLDEICKEETP